MGEHGSSSGHHHSSSSSRKKHSEGSSSSRHGNKHSSSKDSDRHRHSSSKRHRDREAEEEGEWVESAPSAALPATGSSTSASTRPIDPAPSTFEVGRMPSSLGTGLEKGESATDSYGDEGESMGFADFSSMGVERKRREKKELPDPTTTLGQSSREINKSYWQPDAVDARVPAPRASGLLSSGEGPSPRGSPAPGSSGSTWRMARLKRVYETAEEERRPLEEVAVERFGSIEAWHEAEAEKKALDQRDERRRSRGGPSSVGGSIPRPDTPNDNRGRRFIFNEATEPGSTNSSRPSSRNSFRRPGEAPAPERASGFATPPSQTPSIPSIFTPPLSRNQSSRAAAGPSGLSNSTMPQSDGGAVTEVADPNPVKPALSQSELNKLQAKVLKAKLMEAPNADALEKEYEAERQRAVEAAANGFAPTEGGKEVRQLPTLDGRGKLYNVGMTAAEQEEQTGGKRKRKEKYFETHDPKTGERIRINADDDSVSLDHLVREERLGGADQSSMDTELASRIARDGRFQEDLDYQDDMAETLARKKMKTETMKRAFAIQDYARTKKALDSCTMCYSEEGNPPRAAVVALGTRAYLGLMENEELVEGHCRIVPLQHHFSSLEADDDTWEEIKNFMKTLMRMFSEQGKGVVFFESVLNLKWQKHTFIEAIPVPFDLFDELPNYFQSSIDSSEGEWTQHKKRIMFSNARPFRRSLVPNLPYFAVQFDYKGEDGMGHIIEGVDDAATKDEGGYEHAGDVGEKGGGEFPRWFAQEIIGNMLDLEPRRWRKPKRVDFRDNATRTSKFKKMYDSYDWTKQVAS